MNDTSTRLTAVLAGLERAGTSSRSFRAFRAAARENTATGSGKTFLDVLMSLAGNPA